MKKVKIEDIRVNNRVLVVGLLIFFFVIALSGLSVRFPIIMLILGVIFGGVLILSGIYFYIHGPESNIRCIAIIVFAFGLLVVFFFTTMLLGSVAYITTTSSIEPYPGKTPDSDTNLSYEMATENYTDGGNQTPIKKIPIKIRGKPWSGKEQEDPIEINSLANWSFNIVFDSNITEKDAEEIISKYGIPKPRIIERGPPYPRYYISASKSNFEDIKTQLAEEEYVQLSNKIKRTGENVTAVIWVISDQVLPGLRSSDVQLKETMVMQLIYGPETPQTESRNMMRLLDSDEKIINTNVGYLFGKELS